MARVLVWTGPSNARICFRSSTSISGSITVPFPCAARRAAAPSARRWCRSAAICAVTTKGAAGQADVFRFVAVGMGGLDSQSSHVVTADQMAA
jgi:hypothetical protein